MKRKYYYFAMAAVLSFGLLVAPGANADDYYCKGKEKGGSYDNIVVPHGGKCALIGTNVKGNVEVEKGGALTTLHANIEGNISAYEARCIRILKMTYVGGDVKIEKTGYYANEEKMHKKKNKPSRICNSDIGGNIQLIENYVPFEVGCDDNGGNYIGGDLEVKESYVYPKKFKKIKYALSIQHNEIEGNVKIYDNESKSMDYKPLNSWIYGNKIYGNLECMNNYPDPMGDLNFVSGDAQGECSYLAFSCR